MLAKSRVRPFLLAILLNRSCCEASGEHLQKVLQAKFQRIRLLLKAQEQGLIEKLPILHRIFALGHLMDEKYCTNLSYNDWNIVGLFHLVVFISVPELLKSITFLRSSSVPWNK